jgi:hypothetical protein
MLGGSEDWSEAIGRDDRTRRAERQRRLRLANRVLSFYGLRLDDWQGSFYLLANRTGRTEVVDSLHALWPAAAAMAGRPIDPLDPLLLARLEAV